MWTGRTRRTSGITLLMAVLALPACASETPEVTAPTEYCEAVFAAETKPIPPLGSGSDTKTTTVEQVKTYFKEEVRPVADRVIASAPARVAGHVATMAKALAEAERLGSFTPLTTPGVIKAQDEAHAFDLANCGWKTQAITATEYSFGSLPASLPPGPVSFELENAGTEHHEMVIFRKAEDAMQPVADILRLPRTDAEAQLTKVSSQSVTPGASAYLVTKLSPGRYVLACFVPTGSTPENIAGIQEDSRGLIGSPHHTEGMMSEFTV